MHDPSISRARTAPNTPLHWARDERAQGPSSVFKVDSNPHDRAPSFPDVPRQVGCSPHHKAWKEGASPAGTRPIPERAVSLRRGEIVQPQEGTGGTSPSLPGWTVLRSRHGPAFTTQSKNSTGTKRKAAKNPYWQTLRIRGCPLAVPHAPHRKSQTGDIHLCGLLLGL